jgi:hypothetical protein
VSDFDAKLNRRHRNSWRGQQIEVEITDDGKRVMTIYVARRDAYKQGDPNEYEVRVINVTGEEHVEVTLMELHSGEVKVASR